MKTCTKCGDAKPADMFPRHKRQCQACVSAYHKAWVAANSARDRAAKAEWKARNPHYMPEYRWRRRNTDLAYAQYLKMFEAQGGKCLLCGAQHDRLHVDHDHDTGRVRGLLCKRCNLALGCFRDNPVLLETAARYLRNNEKD